MSRHLRFLDPILNWGLTQLSRSRLPVIAGDQNLDGLKDDVEVFRDHWGIPHIFSQNVADLFYAQGYVHAQDRLWQMEFNRRLVAGRVSEILGSLTVQLDRWMRTLTMRRVAEEEVSLLGDKSRGLLQAYADGINSFISNQRLPLEFTLLRHKPEPWQIADILAWIKMMAWNLSVNWEMEILRTIMVERLGPELTSELEIDHPERWPIIVPTGSDYSNLGLNALERANSLRPFIGPSAHKGLGSNNWVISGDKTSTGKPILANDMHLSITLPSIWYENHISCDGLEAIGVTFPGIPGVISGHNGQVAWGLTNGFPDVQDLYIEKIRRTDDGSVQAEYNGQWEDAKEIIETIKVKGSKPVTEKVVITRHGPIINSLALDDAGDQPLALRWTALEPDLMIEGIFDMLSAYNCKEFHKALRQWATPVQNVVYADTAGDIAYTYPGKIPIRKNGDGRLPVPGWTDEYEWAGYIPYGDLPHLYNPQEGYIATANNLPIGPDFPTPFAVEPISGDRAQRINELINTRIGQNDGLIDSDYIQRMQFDQVSPSARIFKDHIIEFDQRSAELSQDLQKAADILTSWDCSMGANSTGAAIYQSLIRNMGRRILYPKLESPKDSHGNVDSTYLATRFMGKGPTPVLAETSISGEFWLPWLLKTLNHSNSHWFDIGGGEQKWDIIHLALQDTIEELTSALGENMDDWSWGKLHVLNYQHILGANQTLGNFYNRGPYPIGGDATTVFATGSSYHDLSSEAFIGPPYRMIVDLGNLNNSTSHLTPGQSGNPSSPFYEDQAAGWLNGKYHPMLFNRSQIEQESPFKLHLHPINQVG